MGDAYDLGGYKMFGIKREHEEYKRGNPSHIFIIVALVSFYLRVE